MIFADAINYAHDLVIECGKLDLPHKMVAHNAIDRIEASYNSDINKLVDENARLKEENAKMRKALSDASDTMRLVIESAEDVMQPHLVQEICHCGLAIEKALAAEGGAK